MRRLLTAFFAFSLIISACTSSGTDETTTTADSVEETTTTADTSDTTMAETTTTTAAAETTTTVEATGSGGPSCLEGQWLFGSESFLAAMQSAMTEADMDGAEIVPNDGVYTVTFNSDGTFTGVREDWGFTVSTSDGDFVITMDGEEEGTWSADADTITVSISSTNVQVTAQVEVDGETFVLPETPVDVPDAIAEESSYSCDSNTLTVTTSDITFVLERA